MPKHYSSLPSRLLTPHQNEWVFSSLRQNCTALVTSVAVLYSYKHSQWIQHHLGVLCIERDDKLKKYFMRFYNLEDMNLLIQQKIKKFLGTPFSVMRNLFFQMVVNGRTIAFEFIDIPAGSEEFCLVTKALRGNLKKLKGDAEARYYEDHPETQKESRFRRLFRRKNKESSSRQLPSDKSPPTDSSQMQQHGKSELAEWALGPGVENMLNIMGVEAEEALKNKDSRQEVEQFIAKYGGMGCFKLISGAQLGSRLDEAASPTQTSVTSPASPKSTLSSVPKTPAKLALDTIAAFKPGKRAQVKKKDDLCKSPAKLFEGEEEFVACEVMQTSPGIDASADTPKPPMSTGKAASPSPSPAKSGTPNEPVRPILSEAFFLELNMMSQKFQERRIKREAEERREQESAKKAKKGQPAAATTPEKTPVKDTSVEKTPEREKTKEMFAFSTPKKSPVKLNETQKTPGEENQTAYMTCVSDSTDETDSDSDDESK